MKTLNQLIDNIVSTYGTVIFVDMARIVAISEDDSLMFYIEYNNQYIGSVMTNYKVERVRTYKQTKERK